MPSGKHLLFGRFFMSVFFLIFFFIDLKRLYLWKPKNGML